MRRRRQRRRDAEPPLVRCAQPGGSIQKIAERCTNESNGDYRISLELLPSDASQQREQLVRRLGAEDSSIDLIGMDVIWTAEFANAGWLRPCEGDEADAVTNGIFDTVLETASFEGKLYGAPFNSNTQLLFYNKSLVPKPPETWDEMTEEAVKLGPADGGSVQVQAFRYEGFTVWVNAMIASAGGEILSGPTTVDLPEEPTDAALSAMATLARSRTAAPGFDTSNEDSARLGFESGSAFMVNYPFAYASAKENAPEVFKNIGVAKYPKVVADHESAPPLGGFKSVCRRSPSTLTKPSRRPPASTRRPRRGSRTTTPGAARSALATRAVAARVRRRSARAT